MRTVCSLASQRRQTHRHKYLDHAHWQRRHRQSCYGRSGHHVDPCVLWHTGHWYHLPPKHHRFCSTLCLRLKSLFVFFLFVRLFCFISQSFFCVGFMMCFCKKRKTILRFCRESFLFVVQYSLFHVKSRFLFSFFFIHLLVFFFFVLCFTPRFEKTGRHEWNNYKLILRCVMESTHFLAAA